MRPKANKIATAIAAANRTVVKNYNAANRAINRAPAWVKWTIAAIAVTIIGYALWKVFFAPGREMFVSGGITYEEKSDTMVKFDYPGFAVFNKYNINNKEIGMTGITVPDAGGMPQFYNFSKDGDRTLELTEKLERAAYFCNKTVTCSGFQLSPEGGVYYLGPTILSPGAGDLVTGSTGYKIFTKKAATTGAAATTADPGAGAQVTVKPFNIDEIQTTGTKFDNINFVGRNVGGSIVVGGSHWIGPVGDVNACINAVKEKGTDMVYQKSTGQCVGKYIRTGDIGKQDSEGIKAESNNDYISISWNDSWNGYNGGKDATSLNAVNGVTGATGATTSLFDVNAANKKVSETKGYEDFTGTGFDGVDFSGGATDHGSMSVEACVDKVRSGVISDMVYDKVNGKCYGKPINYDDIKDWKQKTWYNPSMYSASWHPSLKNMKISKDTFLLVNKIDEKKYWIDSNWEFKAVEGWNYKDLTAWRMEDTGDGTKRIINSNGSARLAKPSTSEFLKIEHAGNNENYTHFTMENIPGTTDEYYLKNWLNEYVVAIRNGEVFRASNVSNQTPNGENFKWKKIPYFISQVVPSVPQVDSGATCGNGKRGNGRCPDPNTCCSTSGWCGSQSEYKSTLNTESKCRP